VVRKYLPDFVVEMTDGSFLIVEVKGQEGDAAIKKAAGERWCKAVTNDGRLSLARNANVPLIARPAATNP
jgi:hypothetical protein